MRFQCSHCQGIVALDDCEFGEAVECGHCHNAVAVPSSRFAPGAMIGDCVLREKLGEGGMGVVYLAHQVSLDRPIALKVLHAQYAADEAYIREFVSEARAAARLNHPSIVQAYAVGEEQGIYYICMEYVEGSTLKDLLVHGGRLVVERGLQIGAEITAALDYAWQSQKLVHRDIKPENIILTRDGKTKLADLGLARRLAADAADNGSGELFGTPQYISPEQLLGEIGDNRSDIYSLGATLFHALTGHCPYNGATPADVARKHFTESLVPPHELIADVAPDVSLLIQIMLAKRPEHRYADAAELAQDLARVRAGQRPLRELDPGAQEPFELLDEPVPAAAVAAAVEEPAAVVEPRDGPVPAEAAGRGPDGAPLKISAPRAVWTATEAAESTGAADLEAVTLVDQVGPGPGAAQPPRITLSKPGSVSRVLKLSPPPRVQREPIRVVEPSAGGIDASADAAAPVPEAGSAPADPSDARQAGGKTGLGFLGAVLVSLGGAAVLTGALALVHRLAFDGGLPEAQAPVPGFTAATVPRQHRDALAEVRALVEQQADGGAILAQAAAFLRAFPEAGDLHAELRDLIRPVQEAEILALRELRHRDVLAEWEQAAARLAAEARAAEAARVQAAQQERERRAEEAAARLAARKREQQLEKLRADQDQLRWEAVALCQDQEFADALALFAPMAASREAEFVTWARNKQQCIELALKTFNLVYNSGDKLRGTKFSIPGRASRFRVYYIGHRAIEIGVRTREYIGENAVDQWSAREKLGFDQVQPGQMWELCKASWSKDGGDPAELDLCFGAYLLATAQRLDVSRAKLEASSDTDTAAPMLAEIEIMAPVVRQKQWEQNLARLTLLVNQGDIQSAARLAQGLRQGFPEEFSRHAEQIQRLLQEN